MVEGFEQCGQLERHARSFRNLGVVIGVAFTKCLGFEFLALTLYKLDQVMQGELDEVIAALATADQAARLADLGA